MKKINYIDLFAGAGGLSEGFIRAGFNPIAHVEMNKDACDTIKTRTAYHWLKDNRKKKIYNAYLKSEDKNKEALWKNIPEHLYNRYIEESEDSEKLRKGLSEAFKRAIAMPTGFPTLFTPILEQALNIDLVTGLPLRGQSQKDLEADLQYSNKYTSQLARLANDVMGVSPITVQNFMNRWLASTSMLISMFTNKLIGDIRGEILPEKTFKEMFLQLPSANKFITKQQNTRNLNDYYELNDIVSAVVDSANKYKDIDYDKFTKFQAKDNNAAIIDMRSELAIISRDLGNLRAYENKIYASKDTGRWTPQTKKQELDRIEQTRQTILGHQQAVQNKLDRRIQNLRSQAGL